MDRPDWKYYYEPDGYAGDSSDYTEHMEKYCDHIESKLHAIKDAISELPSAPITTGDGEAFTHYGIDCKLALDKLETLIK